MKKFIYIISFAFSMSMQVSSYSPPLALPLWLTAIRSTFVVHNINDQLNRQYLQCQQRINATEDIRPDNIARIQDQYMVNTNTGLKPTGRLDCIVDLLSLLGGMKISINTFGSQIYAGLNLTRMMPKLLNAVNAQSNWNKACNEAESITLENITEFHRNDLEALKNKPALAQNNVLIQRENKLIDKVNEQLFSGKKDNNSILSSKLKQLQECRNIGKSKETLKKEEALRDKINSQQWGKRAQAEMRCVSKDFREELVDTKLAVLPLIKQQNGFRFILGTILTEWLPSSDAEGYAINQTLHHDNKVMDLPHQIEALQRKRLQSNKEWQQLENRNKHEQWLSSMKSCDKKVALLKFVR